MRIFVKAKTGSKKEEVIPPVKKLWSEGRAGDFYIVHTKEQPVDGKANQAIARLLALHFSISQSSLTLVSGASSKIKVFEVPDIVSI